MNPEPFVGRMREPVAVDSSDESGEHIALDAAAERKLRADVATFVGSAPGRRSLMRDGASRMGWIIRGTPEELADLEPNRESMSSARVWLGSDGLIYSRQIEGSGSDALAANATEIYALFDRVGFIPNPDRAESPQTLKLASAAVAGPASAKSTASELFDRAMEVEFRAHGFRAAASELYAEADRLRQRAHQLDGTRGQGM